VVFFRGLYVNIGLFSLAWRKRGEPAGVFPDFIDDQQMDCRWCLRYLFRSFDDLRNTF
jgi:hypothetical protein